MIAVMPEKLRRSSIMSSVLAGLLLLTGCSATVDIQAAPDAGDPDCAHTMIAMPDELAGLEKRRTNAQATAAWGEPVEVILRCGVPEPGVTSDLCVGANGVDWLTREGEGGNWAMLSYGRSPAVEVIFNPEDVSSSTVMTELAKPVSMIEATKFCSTREQDVDFSKTDQGD